MTQLDQGNHSWSWFQQIPTECLSLERYWHHVEKAKNLPHTTVKKHISQSEFNQLIDFNGCGWQCCTVLTFNISEIVHISVRLEQKNPAAAKEMQLTVHNMNREGRVSFEKVRGVFFACLSYFILVTTYCTSKLFPLWDNYENLPHPPLPHQQPSSPCPLFRHHLKCINHHYKFVLDPKEAREFVRDMRPRRPPTLSNYFK